MSEKGLSNRWRGFTLVELSIVLVIIGLIVGGLLAGQSLTGAAAVRAQITQIEKFNTAVNIFYGKYGALPGDLSPAIATQFGFTSRPGAPGIPPVAQAAAIDAKIDDAYPQKGRVQTWWITDLSIFPSVWTLRELGAKGLQRLPAPPPCVSTTVM